MPGEGGVAVIDIVMFCENGNYCAFSGKDQVVEEQGSAWLEVLQEKLDRGAIGPSTKVRMPAWETVRCVQDLIDMEHLHVEEK
jgi:hypothetical protein